MPRERSHLLTHITQTHNFNTEQLQCYNRRIAALTRAIAASTDADSLIRDNSLIRVVCSWESAVFGRDVVRVLFRML